MLYLDKKNPVCGNEAKKCVLRCFVELFLCIGLPPSETIIINNLLTHLRGPVRRRDPCSGRSWQSDRRTTSRVGSMYRRQPGSDGNTTVL